MIWIILCIAAVGLCLLLSLHFRDKSEKNSIGGKIASYDEKFRYIGNILHQEKTDVKVNDIVGWNLCIKQDEFLFSYDEWGRMDIIVLHSGDKYYEVFNLDFDTKDELYEYKSGAWDSFLLNAIHELHQRAVMKDQDELLSESCKKIFVENYFNELFAKKD